MSARMVTYKEGQIDLAFPITQKITGIGRAPDNLIQLPDSEVSKHHAVIREDGDGWQIVDLGSQNGVLVNGKRVQRSALMHGDRVRIGAQDFVFETAFRGAWVPSHVIDFSAGTEHRTELQPPVKDPRPPPDKKR